MEITVQYDEEHDCLVGTLKGPMDTAAIQAYSKEVMKVASGRTCRKLLTDMREADVEMCKGELYYLAGLLEDEGLDQSWRRAIVMTKQQKDYEFYERVSGSQGFTVKIFSDMEDAFGWLAAGEE